MLWYIPYIPNISTNFILNGCWILSKDFYASKEKIKEWLFFNLLIWWVTFNDFHILIHLGWSHLDHGKSFSDVFFTFLIWFVWIFSLLLVNCNKGLSILLIFLKSNFLFHWIFIWLIYLLFLYLYQSWIWLFLKYILFWIVFFFLLQFPGVLINY